MAVEKIELTEVQNGKITKNPVAGFHDILNNKINTMKNGNHVGEIEKSIKEKNLLESALLYGIPVQMNIKNSIKNNVQLKVEPFEIRVPEITKVNNNLLNKYKVIEDSSNKKNKIR